MMEFVNGKDDIPFKKWKIKHVPNHQPGGVSYQDYQVPPTKIKGKGRKGMMFSLETWTQFAFL